MHIRMVLAFILTSVMLPAGARFVDERIIEETAEEAAGVQSTTSALTAETAASVEAPARSRAFEIRADDESLSLALRRWAQESKYQLVWDAGKDFRVKETTYRAQNIVGAVEQVMADTERSSYPLHACSYRNNVIRVLHISQPCERRNK